MRKLVGPDQNAQHWPVSDWLAACCLTASGDDDLGGARLQSWKQKNGNTYRISILFLIIITVSTITSTIMIIIIIIYSLFFWLHHSNLSLFFNCTTTNKPKKISVTLLICALNVEGQNTWRHRALRGASHLQAWGECEWITWWFDGVDERVTVCLAPADGKDVDGVHVHYQLRHGLFQTCVRTYKHTQKYQGS